MVWFLFALSGAVFLSEFFIGAGVGQENDSFYQRHQSGNPGPEEDQIQEPHSDFSTVKFMDTESPQKERQHGPGHPAFDGGG